MEEEHKILFAALSLLVFFCVISLGSGCGCDKKEGDEPTKYRSQEGLEKLSRDQGQISKKDNRTFSSSKDVGAKAPEVKDLDGILHPVLKRLFGDVKIIVESKSPQTQRDGEVVENRFTYLVRKIMTTNDGFALHSALRAAGFVSSPRLGSKPTEWKGNVAMSLMRTTSMRGYSLVINVDTNKQQITVESYRLGSKYDRLM